MKLAKSFAIACVGVLAVTQANAALRPTSRVAKDRFALVLNGKNKKFVNAIRRSGGMTAIVDGKFETDCQFSSLKNSCVFYNLGSGFVNDAVLDFDDTNEAPSGSGQVLTMQNATIRLSCYKVDGQPFTENDLNSIFGGLDSGLGKVFNYEEYNAGRYDSFIYAR